jgi:hypothetical protein
VPTIFVFKLAPQQSRSYQIKSYFSSRLLIVNFWFNLNGIAETFIIALCGVNFWIVARLEVSIKNQINC